MICDICRNDCTAHYYDCKSKQGPWANLCPKCWPKYRASKTLGTGYGQEYKLVDGKSKKVTG